MDSGDGRDEILSLGSGLPCPMDKYPPWITVVDKAHLGYTKVVEAVRIELGPKSYSLPFTYLLVNVEQGRRAAEERPKEVRRVKKNKKIVEEYFYNEEQLGGLSPLVAPAAVLCPSKIKEGEFHVLLIAIDNACTDMQRASVLGGGTEAWAYAMKEEGCVVTAPGRATVQGASGVEPVYESGILNGFMVFGGTRSTYNPTCVENGQAWGPNVAGKVVLQSLCSLAAALIEREATHIIWPFFGGSAARLNQLVAGAKTAIILGSIACTAKAATLLGYGNTWHMDVRDFGGYSWLIFYLLGDERAIRGGTFYFPTLGLKFQPGKCSALYLETSAVEHATFPSWSEPAGAARYVATAIYANKQALGASENYLMNGKINAGFYLESVRIGERIRKDPQIAAVLELNQNIVRY